MIISHIKFLSWTRRVLVFSIPMIILTACPKPSEDDFVGAEYIVAPADLKVMSFNAPTSEVDFETDSAAFSGALSHRVSWFLNLKGLSSGAVKSISGLSDTINPREIFWKGSHDGLYFFRTGEKVVAELTFLKSDLVTRDTFIIDKEKTYNGLLLFSGFEAAKSGSGLKGWPTEFEFGETGEPSAYQRREADGAFSIMASDLHPVQGKHAFLLGGIDQNNTYFIGGVRAGQQEATKPSKSPVAKPRHFQFNSTKPDSVYFNVYIYGDGNSTTRASIAVAEDDNSDDFYLDAEAAAHFKGVSEDVWEYAFKINWRGWRLISVKYADFVRATETGYGGSGNGIKELNKVKKISFNVLSDPPGNPASYYLDFPIITFNGPFNPNQ